MKKVQLFKKYYINGHPDNPVELEQDKDRSFVRVRSKGLWNGIGTVNNNIYVGLFRYEKVDAPNAHLSHVCGVHLGFVRGDSIHIIGFNITGVMATFTVLWEKNIRKEYEDNSVVSIAEY